MWYWLTWIGGGGGYPSWICIPSEKDLKRKRHNSRRAGGSKFLQVVRGKNKGKTKEEREKGAKKERKGGKREKRKKGREEKQRGKGKRKVKKIFFRRLSGEGSDGNFLAYANVRSCSWSLLVYRYRLTSSETWICSVLPSEEIKKKKKKKKRDKQKRGTSREKK